MVFGNLKWTSKMWSEQNLSWKSRKFNGGMDKRNNKLTKFPILQKLTGGMIDF